MNATNFFTEETFNRIKADIKAKKVINYLNCPYEFICKVKGNKYKISLHTGYYTGTNEYFYSFWIDYNFANPPYSRSIGRGTYSHISLDNYEAFNESINRILINYPDYTEEETPLQFAIDF